MYPYGVNKFPYINYLSNVEKIYIQLSDKYTKGEIMKILQMAFKALPQQQAKVSLSSTYEMNPYLLLMAHSFIKNTIVIDSNMSFS